LEALPTPASNDPSCAGIRQHAQHRDRISVSCRSDGTAPIDSQVSHCSWGRAGASVCARKRSVPVPT
jgi:hypothetical protein